MEQKVDIKKMMFDREVNAYKTAWFESKPKRTRHKHFDVYELGNKTNIYVYNDNSGWRECFKPSSSYRVSTIGKTHDTFEALQKHRQDEFDGWLEHKEKFYNERFFVC